MPVKDVIKALFFPVAFLVFVVVFAWHKEQTRPPCKEGAVTVMTGCLRVCAKGEWKPAAIFDGEVVEQ